MLLGCIADDITGATDLALMLARSGMRTVQVIGVPEAGTKFGDFDAVVVALKSRTNPPDEAVAWSLAACDVLLADGAQQIFFKYCSTFDSTEKGNIGPVADALLAKLGAQIAIACPAFPANARSVYQGYLFVGDQLLSDSPMKDHPLTPMRDSSLVRVLAAQSQHSVGLVTYFVVEAGPGAVKAMIGRAHSEGHRYVIVDAINERHLHTIGEAAADHKLITGGSGIAVGLAKNFIDRGQMSRSEPETRMAARPGRAAILAGSCSAATRGQVAAAIEAGVPTRRIQPLDLAEKRESAADLLAWALQQPVDQPILIYSSDDPENVREVQDKLGRDAAGALIERTLAEVARGLAVNGFTRMIVAGGETSGAAIDALGVSAISIGPEIDPGVPWTRSTGDDGLVLAFKSGNFGTPDFFLKAWDLLS
ncbi:MAG: 3-oxo-tetronate kinase [Pseudomonadota bacterium]